MKRENIKMACEVLAWLSVLGGIILGIYLGYRFGYEVSYSSYSSYVHKDRNNFLTFIYFVIPTAAGVIEAIAFYALSTILNNQEEMMYKINKHINTDKNSNDVYKDAKLPPL